MSAQVRAEHECAGCGGTGDQPQRKPFIPDSDEGRYFWRCGTCDSQNSRTDGECQFCECAGLDCTRASCSDPRHFVPCAACAGSGRISDRMPVADALADAETLRAFVRDPYPPHLLLRALCPSAYDVDPSALRCGISTDLWKRGHFYETERGLVNDAVYAARAAFRAVPGLREP